MFREYVRLLFSLICHLFLVVFDDSAGAADMSDSEGSFTSGEYEDDELDQHLLAMPHDDLVLSDDKPVRLAKELL